MSEDLNRVHELERLVTSEATEQRMCDLLALKADVAHLGRKHGVIVAPLLALIHAADGGATADASPALAVLDELRAAIANEQSPISEPTPGIAERLTVSEAARAVGVERWHITRLCKSGELPHEGTGRERRIHGPSLIAFFANNRPRPRLESDADVERKFARLD